MVVISEVKGRGRMRSAMPTVAGWIDELREVFGADQVDPSIGDGMRGEPNKFWASEAGMELGTQFDRAAGVGR